MIAGDFNAGHQNWGVHTQNNAGIQLLDCVHTQNLTIFDHFDGNTFVCEGGGSRTDLVLVSANLGSNLIEQHTDGDTGLLSGAQLFRDTLD